MKNITALSVLMLATTLAQAQERPYCELVGMALGADRDLAATIGTRIITRNGQLGTPGCQADWNAGYEIGSRARNGTATALDQAPLTALDAFEAEIADVIIARLTP